MSVLFRCTTFQVLLLFPWVLAVLIIAFALFLLTRAFFILDILFNQLLLLRWLHHQLLMQNKLLDEHLFIEALDMESLCAATAGYLGV